MLKKFKNKKYKEYFISSNEYNKLVKQNFFAIDINEENNELKEFDFIVFIEENSNNYFTTTILCEYNNYYWLINKGDDLY